VADESHLHEGHAGHRPGGETHFRVYIVADVFAGKSPIERHRMINGVLSFRARSRSACARDPGPRARRGCPLTIALAGSPYASLATGLRASGMMRSAVIRLRSLLSTRKSKAVKGK